MANRFTQFPAALGLSVALIVLMPSPAEACTCMLSGPPCQEAWKSPLVFVGTVIEVDHAPGALGPRRVRFKITEAFRGTEGGEIEIHLRGGGGPSCDPAFRMGEAWLVYAGNRWEGGPGWTTSTCSRTRRLSMAAEDLKYLRLPDEQKPPSHIEGRVMRENVPLADVPVIVTSGETRIEARTDRDGRYLIPVDTFRSYQIEFGRGADGLVIQEGRRQVLLPHHLACAVVDVYARPSRPR